MITIVDGIRSLVKNYPEVIPQAIYNYSDDMWMVLASHNDGSENSYYAIEKSTGRTRYLNPLEDIDLFNSALENGLIMPRN